MFTDESSDSDGTIATHSWDFGDGATSAEPSPTHGYEGQGTYTVSLTVTDDGGASNTPTAEVEVIDPTQPNARPIASFTNSCTDLSCGFTNTSTDPDGDPLTYSWDFGDGATSTATNPSHVYSAAGEYTVTLTVDDGTDTATASVTVTEPGGSSVITAAIYPILGEWP